MGGQSIFRVKENDPNLNVILETLTDNGGVTIVAQQYLPAIKDGDKRVLMINGEAVPFCLARPDGGGRRTALRRSLVLCNRCQIAIAGLPAGEPDASRERITVCGSISLATISPRSMSPAQPACAKSTGRRTHKSLNSSSRVSRAKSRSRVDVNYDDCSVPLATGVPATARHAGRCYFNRADQLCHGTPVDSGYGNADPEQHGTHRRTAHCQRESTRSTGRVAPERVRGQRHLQAP